MVTKFNVALLCTSALATFAIGSASPAFAQDSAPVPAATPTDAPAVQAGADATGADITVTARRREESIVDVPLAISVVSSAKLEQLNIRSTTDLANYVPGLQFSDYTPGYARNDRGATRPLIFRGLNVGQGGSVVAAGGLFLDGAAVVGNEVPAGMDIGAVEVLRGPQSVYFGRSTMTGAVSYRTKPISKTDWSAEAEGSIAERNSHTIEASIAGPIVQDLLGVRVTGLWEKTGGYTTNDYDGSKLGNRDRHSISATVDFTPTDSIELKGYANFFRDDDGPSATIFVPATLNNCKVGTTQTTFCGKIPGRSNSINYFNTNFPPSTAPVIFGSVLRVGKGFKQKLGLQRDALNTHLVANWQVSDYLKIQSITGYHTNATQQGADGITQPIKPTFPYSAYFYTITNRARDFSQELRLSSDPERAFSWTAGANYVNAYNKTNALLTFYNQAGTLSPSYQNISLDAAKTYGFFGGAYLKLLDDKLTLSAEGRYQIDKRESAQNVANPNGVTLVINGTPTLYPYRSTLLDLKKDFKSFSPRVSIDYDVGGRRKIYASYATGNRPGGFNTNLQTYYLRGNPVLTSQLNTLLGGAPLAYAEEKLRIGELGFKGDFGGGKGYFDINAYYGTLGNQQIGFGTLIPALGFSVTAQDNIGKTKVYGVEFQGNYNFSRNLSLATTFAWNHTDRTRFLFSSGLPQFGTTNLDGVQMANTPQFSGSAVASYNHPLTDDWNIFTNVSYVYRGKQFVDVANLSYIKGRSQVDYRLGVSNEHYTIEAFVTNVLNDRNYTGGSVAPDFGTNSFNAFFGAAAPPRTVGGRLRVKI